MQRLVKKSPAKFIVYGDNGCFIKYSSGHQHKNPHGPTVVSMAPEAEANWGELWYRDENGNDCHKRVPSEVTDYGLLYQALYRAIRHGEAKPVPDDEVLGVMALLEGGVAAAKNQARRNG